MDIKVGQMVYGWKVLKKRGSKYLCLCTLCNNAHSYVKKSDLVAGKSRMCAECSKNSLQTHHLSDTTEYNTWVHINQRCHNPKNKDYARYGGRGIEVYPLWRDNFDAFFMYIGPKPYPEASIDRIDHNGNYEPGNVEWASKKQQTDNRRNTILITIDQETKPLSDWLVDSELPYQTVYGRIKKGWLEKYGPKITLFEKDINAEM